MTRREEFHAAVGYLADFRVLLGVLVGIISSVTGAFSWSTAHAKEAAQAVLLVHEAEASQKGRIMCTLADYMAGSEEKRCEANGITCPRPPDLETEAIWRVCNVDVRNQNR